MLVRTTGAGSLDIVGQCTCYLIQGGPKRKQNRFIVCYMRKIAYLEYGRIQTLTNRLSITVVILATRKSSLVSRWI